MTYIIMNSDCLYAFLSTAMSGYEGNGTFANVLAQSPQWGTSSTSLAAILIALSIAGLFSVFRSSSASDDKIPKLKGFHLATAWRFFTRRYDFFGENFKKTKSTIFSFRVLQVGFMCLYLTSWDRFLSSIA